VTRKISKTPFKVLDAPELQDDFYLNLLDWSSQNILSVGLGTAVYLWSAASCQVVTSFFVSSGIVVLLVIATTLVPSTFIMIYHYRRTG